jgi:hypothetical protein
LEAHTERVLCIAMAARAIFSGTGPPLLGVYCTLRQGMFGKYSHRPEEVHEVLYLTIDLRMSPILTMIALIISLTRGSYSSAQLNK